MKNANIEGYVGLLLGAGFLGTFGTAIALGITLKSFWLVLLLLMAEGYIITSMSQVQLTKGKTNYGALVFYFILGVASILGALFVAKFRGGWLWTIGMITIGMMMLIMCSWMFKDGSPFLGGVLLVTGLGLVFLSVAGPIRTFDRIQANLYGEPGPTPQVTEVAQVTEEVTEIPQPTNTIKPTEAPTEEPTDGVEESVVSDVQETAETGSSAEKIKDSDENSFSRFINRIFGSIWGLVYLGAFILIGQFTFRKGGWFFFLIGFSVVLLLLSRINPQQLVGVNRIFSYTPSQIWQTLMMNNMFNLGINLPVMLMGLALVVMGLPFQIETYLYSEILRDSSKGDAFYRKASKKNWELTGNILFAILLLTAVITLLLFHFQTGIFFPGFRGILSPYFYISTGLFIGLAIWLRAAVEECDESLFYFLSEKTSPTGLGIACGIVALFIPFGVMMLLIGITLGLCLLYTALRKMEASI
jgi:hypothetical protein